MELKGNTVLITGGGSGIGAGLAVAFHTLGNKVIVAGRHRAPLEALADDYPGIDVLSLDIADPAAIERTVIVLTQDYPLLNVLINNAGIMLADDAANPIDDARAMAQIVINLLGPIRLTSALLPLLRRQPRAHIVYNSSAWGFTPLAPFAVHSATKAGLHSYVLSQRFLLKDSRVTVQELVPPWVGTGLMGPANHPLAMPLDRFIEAAMTQLATDEPEVLVNESRIYRNNAGPTEHTYVDQLNTFFLGQSY